MRARVVVADPEDDRRARCEVEGLERLDPSRSYVFAANHQSIYDIPIVFASLPFQLRIIAKESLGKIPFMGWHLQRTGHVLVDRSKPGAGIMKKMARLVAAAALADRVSRGDAQHRRQRGAVQGGLVPDRARRGPAGRADQHPGQPSRDVPRATDGVPRAVTVIVHEPIETAGVPRDAVREFSVRVHDVVASAAA